MSLRARVLMLIGLILAAGILIGAALAGYEAKRTLHNELEAGMAGGQQTVLSAFEDLPRSDHAPRDLHQLIATFNGNRHVRARLVTNAGGRLESSARLKPFLAPPAWFSRLLGPPPPDIRIPAPAPVVDRAILLQPISDIDIAALWSEFCRVLIALGVSVVAGLLLVYLAIGAALRPLSALSAGFARVGVGDDGVRVPLGGPPELIGLQRGFNDMVERLTVMNRHNRVLEAQLITLQDEERADLARDLHDEMGPHLFAINVDAEIVSRTAVGETLARLRAIRGSVGHMQKLVREMLGRLRPSRPAELGLNPAIADLIAFWRERAPTIDIRYAPLADERLLDEAIKDAVYRIIQESLNNAVRHAGAGLIEVRVAVLDGGENEGERQVEVRVADNGISDVPPKPGGFGLVGMRERVKSVGGVLVVDAHDSGPGWSVTALLPVKAPAPDADPEAVA